MQTTPSIDWLMTQFRNEFMRPDVHGPVLYWEVETPNGTEIVPGFVCPTDKIETLSQFVGDKIASVERKVGYVYRMSAPGYMDATAWEAGASLEEVEQWLAEQAEEIGAQ